MKTLVIINGVTGAIGSACLAQFSRDLSVNIIGLSRQSRGADAFCVNGLLPDNTLICSVGDLQDAREFGSFATKIDKNLYEKIIYIHSVGMFPSEMNFIASHDADGDGIDDRVMQLSHHAFFAMTDALKQIGLPLHAWIFGSIADAHKPMLHKSWWMVMEKNKARMKQEAEQNKSISFGVLNISSVICPNELIARPFVFQNTNANPRFWLLPSEIAERLHILVSSNVTGFVEQELFHPADYYKDDHFADAFYLTRRKAELGLC